MRSCWISCQLSLSATASALGRLFLRGLPAAGFASAAPPCGAGATGEALARADAARRFCSSARSCRTSCQLSVSAAASALGRLFLRPLAAAGFASTPPVAVGAGATGEALARSEAAAALAALPRRAGPESGVMRGGAGAAGAAAVAACDRRREERRDELEVAGGVMPPAAPLTDAGEVASPSLWVESGGETSDEGMCWVWFGKALVEDGSAASATSSILMSESGSVDIK